LLVIVLLTWLLFKSLNNASNTAEHIDNKADLFLALWRRRSLDFVKQLSALLQLL